MSVEVSANNPEKKEKLDDNARKFVIKALDPEFLETNGVSSFTLTVDWLKTGEDNEVKVARKEFENGETQILLITKTTKGGNRTSEKEKITQERYQQLRASSVRQLEKKRYEFEYEQNGTRFSVKYDEFANGKLSMLEVDASNAVERSSFRPDDLPVKLEEVTGDIRYYGYRVTEIV
jgi:hypothetical protein